MCDVLGIRYQSQNCDIIKSLTNVVRDPIVRMRPLFHVLSISTLLVNLGSSFLFR